MLTSSQGLQPVVVPPCPRPCPSSVAGWVVRLLPSPREIPRRHRLPTRFLWAAFPGQCGTASPRWPSGSQSLHWGAGHTGRGFRGAGSCRCIRGNPAKGGGRVSRESCMSWNPCPPFIKHRFPERSVHVLPSVPNLISLTPFWGCSPGTQRKFPLSSMEAAFEALLLGLPVRLLIGGPSATEALAREPAGRH